MIVVWRVTETCNLACPFCAYDRRVRRSRMNADPAQVHRFGAVLADYQRSTQDRVLVSWLGGEPFLWDPLSELTRTFAQDYGLAVSTTTNGTRLDSAAVRAHIIAHYTEVTFSIDALPTQHDELRGCPGLSQRLEKNIRLLAHESAEQGHGPKLRANIVLMRTNLPSLETLCRELADWGITEISFNQLGGNDRPEFYPANRLLPAQVESLREGFPVLKRELAEQGVRLLGGPSYLRRMHASSTDRRLPIEECHPGESFLFIDERGRIAPCSFTGADYGVGLDELRSAEALLALPLVFAEARRTRRAASCEDCLSTHVFAKFTHAHGT